MGESIEQVIARSSLGGHAWCICKHPDLVHESHSAASPFSEKRGACGERDCDCGELHRMTPTQWLQWKGHA